MKQEEQLNRYFEHTMTPSEEQNFLISVAASDQMRIAFRSQLELMKAVRSDKDALHAGMSGHPVAHVRYRTLAALGLSATAASPLLDQEFTRETAAHAAIPATVTPRLPWFSTIMRTPTLALTAGLALGILSTTAVMHYTEGSPAPIVRSVSTIPSVVPMKTPTNVQTNEPITIPNGLNNSSHSEGLAVHHAAPVSMAGTEQTSVKTAAPNSIPVTSTSNAGTMGAHTKINRLNDSSAAK
jgi:hypothetical protein